MALRILLRRLLAAGDERRQPLHILIVLRRHVLRARLKMLRLLRWLLMLLRLLMLLVRRLILLRLVLLARIKRLRLPWRERLAGHAKLIAVVVVVTVIGEIAGPLAWLLWLLLVKRLSLSQLFLRGRNQAEVMFGVLIVVFGGDRIAGALRVTGELEVFLGNVGCRSPDFHIRSVRLVHT